MREDLSETPIDAVNYAIFSVKMGKKRNRLIIKKGKYKMTNTNESGRSMVEMLGVLAIIGVLSVMGIAGYTQAMKRYRANETAAEISMGAMLCASQKSVDGMDFKFLDGATCNGDELRWTGYKQEVAFDDFKNMFNPALTGASYKIIS